MTEKIRSPEHILAPGAVFMNQYEIMLGDKSVGRALVSQEGLYYRFRCSCNLSGETLCRIMVRCGNRMENLGVLVPKDGEFILETRIPVKKIGEGQISFSVAPRHRTPEAEFIPLSPEEPFHYITRLKDAYLERKNGKLGLRIKEPGCG